MKPKATTIQERMGFRDPELSTPEHDAIILWLIKNKAWTAHYLMPKSFVNRVSNGIRRPTQEEVESVLPQWWADYFDPAPSAKTEVPIKSGAFVVGFIDLVIRKGFFEVGLDNGEAWCEHEEGSGKRCTVAIEVKPKITSFGETMRQIRHYQEFATDMQFAICTPDLRFKEAFIEQGINCFWIDDVKSFAEREIASRQMLLAGEVTDGTR